MKKKSKVVMLPTDEKVQVNQIYKDEGELKVSKEINRTFSGQHLYFTSDEYIKEGWVIDNDNELKYINSSVINTKTGIARHLDDTPFILDGCRKIIATTDTSIREHDDTVPYPKTKEALPQIPQSFIEEYARQGGIDEVELELELKPIPKDMPIDYEMLDETHHSNHRLKLTSNNEVIVNLIEEKMYSKEILISMLKRVFIEGGKCARNFEYDFDIDEWIKENL